MSKPGIVYGLHPVQESIRSRPKEIKKIYVSASAQMSRLKPLLDGAKKQLIPVEELPKNAFHDLVGDVNHQGVAAAMDAFEYCDLDDMLTLAANKNEQPLLVALDQVQDIGNLGAIIRSAFALGAHGLFFPKDRSAEVTPAVVRSSAGATQHLLIAQVTNLSRALAELKEKGLWVVGTAMDGSEAIDCVDLTVPSVLVIGSEGQGLRRLVSENCDRLVHIPMTGDLGSLNASVAAAISLYEASRQRRTRR